MLQKIPEGQANYLVESPPRKEHEENHDDLDASTQYRDENQDARKSPQTKSQRSCLCSALKEPEHKSDGET